jgi:hypothetical protein
MLKTAPAPNGVLKYSSAEREGVQSHSAAGGAGVPPITPFLNSPSWRGRGRGMVDTLRIAQLSDANPGAPRDL